MEEPVERLMEAARNAGVAASVCVLPEGETEIISPDALLQPARRATLRHH
jgi:hypothetical protein